MGPDIPRTSTRISRRTSGGKNFGQALEILEKNKHFGADIHDPKARTSMTRRGVEKNFGLKKFGLNFHSLIGDEKITYLIFTPDELFSVIPCVLCVGKRTSRGTNTELLDKITLPNLFAN